MLREKAHLLHHNERGVRRTYRGTCCSLTRSTFGGNARLPHPDDHWQIVTWEMRTTNQQCDTHDMTMSIPRRVREQSFRDTHTSSRKQGLSTSRKSTLLLPTLSIASMNRRLQEVLALHCQCAVRPRRHPFKFKFGSGEVLS